MKAVPLRLSVSVGLTIAVQCGAQAHMIDREISIEKRVPEESKVPNLRSDEPFSPKVVEGVIDQFKLWQTGSTLKVCFFDGGASLRKVFADTAKEWTSNGSLKLDFGPSGNYYECNGQPYHIRVSFGWQNDPSNWSLVGTDAIRIRMSEPSLNIGFARGMDGALAGPQLKFLILHELGHALAMQHEHQSPEAQCDSEFNWPTIYSTYLQQHGWSRETVDNNLRTMSKGPRLRTTAYDRRSIMHYYFAPWMFKAGQESRCYVGQNTELSELDKRAFASAYPARGEEQVQLVRKRKEFASDLLATLQPSSEQRARLEEVIEKASAAQFNVINSGNVSICSNMSGSITITQGSNSSALACAEVRGDMNLNTDNTTINNNATNQSGNFGTLNNSGTTNFNQTNGQR